MSDYYADVVRRRARGEALKLMTDRVAQAFGVPPHLLGEFPREPEPIKLPAAVIGYRAWRLEGPALCPAVSLLGPPPWSRGVNRARCIGFVRTHDGHDAPVHGCSCGLHAFHDPLAALSYARNEVGPWCPIAFGAVVAWGRMEVAINGFRAEYAQIVAVDSQAPAEYYGVPAVPFEELESVAREHGDPVPVELRPEQAADEDDSRPGTYTRYVRGGFGPVDEPPQPFT
jgi:hypothetical protein